MSDVQSLIEQLGEVARYEAEQEFVVKTVAWEQKLMDAQRRATSAEAAAAEAVEAKFDAEAALVQLRVALRELLP